MQDKERKSKNLRAALVPTQAVKGPPQIQVQARVEEVDRADTRLRLDKVHNCLLCEAKEGRNLNFSSGLMQLRKHYSVCLYNRGQFKSVGNPKEANRNEEGKVVDENGLKFRYRCDVPDCSRRGVKPLSFKEWAIHAGVVHHLMEKVMEEEAERNPAMKEVLAELAKVREVKVVEKEKQEQRRKDDQEEKQKQEQRRKRKKRQEEEDEDEGRSSKSQAKHFCLCSPLTACTESLW